MSVGLWVAPTVLAGLFAVLWLATALERLVALPSADPELPALEGPGPDLNVVAPVQLASAPV
jgi:hypothetical protein